MLKRYFPASQFGRIQVEIKTKRGRYLTLSVPSVIVLCPCCNGRASRQGGCELCDTANVIEVVADEFLQLYPKINKAMLRYDIEKQNEAWESYGERVWGC